MYAKLFSRITESSLMEEDIPTRYTFVMLLAICDPTGHVIGTDVAIARRLNMPVAAFRRCAKVLGEIDRDSNSQECEGRRLVQSDGERGYRVVNYEKYRDMRDEDQRREYMRLYMQDRRAREAAEKASLAPVNSVSSGKPALAQAPASVEETAQAEADKKQLSAAGAALMDGVEEVVAHYLLRMPKRRPGKTERSKIRSRLGEGRTVAELCRAIDGCLGDRWHVENGHVGLELIVRNAAKVDDFLHLAEHPRGAPSSVSVAAADSVEKKFLARFGHIPRKEGVVVDGEQGPAEIDRGSA